MFQQEIKNPWEMFEKRLGTSGAGGQFYERELAMLMLLQGVTKKRSGEIKQFYLATNMKKLGNFDDIAFKYKYLDESGEEKSKVIFLQAKHKTNPLNEKELITINRLLSDSDQKDAFALREYFSSFIEVKKRFNEKQEMHPLFEGDFKDCDFVIYTNALPHENCTENDRVLRRIDSSKDYVLNLGEDCCYYELVFGENKELDQKVKDVLEYSCNCKKLAKALVKAFFPSNKCAELTNQGVIKKYHWCLAEKVIKIVKRGEGKISEFFLDDERNLSLEDKVFKVELFHEMSKIKELSGKSIDELKAILAEKLIKIPKDFGDIHETTQKLALPADLVFEQDIKEFLSKLKLFLGQPNYTKLSKLIKTKIQERYKVTLKVDVENIFSKVNKYVEQWWMAEKSSYYLTEKFDYFHQEKVYLDNLKRPSALNLPQLWHVPPQNDHFVGRRSLLDRLSDLLNLNAAAHVVACHGLRGVGKTQLALQFAQNNLNNYKGIIWLNATDRNTFANEYIALGHDLNIIRGDEENTSNEILAKRLKIWLEDPEHTGWLMICDNAPNYKEVADLLPSRGGKILFTSRYGFAWPQSKNIITVDVFNTEESRNLVQSILDEEGDDQSIDFSLVDELSETLGHLPLALAQATTYIKKTQMCISVYLNSYKIRKQTLLSSEVLLETYPAGCSRESTAIVYATWDFTMSTIQKMSSLAANWLTICAYLNSNDIPVNLLDIFSSVPENNPLSECYHEALGTLKSYSMLNVNKQLNSMSVHKLVQEVTLLKSKEKGETENDLKRALNLIKTDILENPKCIVDHAISVWNHGCNFLNLVTQFCELPSSIIVTLFIQVRFQEAILFGKRAIVLLQEMMGSYHHSTMGAKDFTARILAQQGRYEDAFNIYKAIFEKGSQALGPNHELILTAKRGIAMVLSLQGKFDEALEILTATLQKVTKNSDDQCSEILYIKYAIANILVQKEKYEDAIRIHEEIYNEIKKDNGNLHLHVYIVSLKNMTASFYDKRGEYDKAIAFYEEIMDILKDNIGLFHPDTFAVKQSIGKELLKKGECEKAFKIFKDVIEVASRSDVLGSDHPMTLTFEGNLAVALFSQGNLEASLKAHTEVIEKSAKILGCYHPSTIKAKLNMALVLDEQGKYEEALKIYDENMRHLIDIFGPVHQDTVIVKNNKANLLMKMHKYYDALQIHAEVYDVQKKPDSLGPLHRQTLNVKNNMAVSLDNLGKHSEALEMFHEILEIERKYKILARDFILIVKSNMAVAFDNLCKYDEALLLLKEVYEKYTEILGPDHPTTLVTFCKMWEVFVKLGMRDEAGNLLPNLLTSLLD